MGETDEGWVIEVNDKLKEMDDSYKEKEMEHWMKRSIYRVPPSVTQINMKAYIPQSVSIGPYHHGEKHLEAMEEHKQRALLHFLKRSKKPLESYVKPLSEIVEDLKDSYDCLNPKWHKDTHAFLKLMILDGIFMLEILRMATQTTSDYAGNDPIFSHHGMLYIIPYVKRDMLMLENQLPMVVLHNLLAVEHENKSKHEDLVNRLVLKFCCPNMRSDSNIGKCLHVLDVYRKSLLWEDPRRKKTNRQQRKAMRSVMRSEDEDDIIRSATELNEAGIRFKKSETRSLKDISFHGGVLKLPPIVVDDAMESMFLNQIAFERFHVGAGNEVTSYIFFMDNIIDNAKDVSLLHSQGIIQNAIGSDKSIAKLFNSLSKDVTLDPDSSLDIVHRKVHRYCKKPWNEWRANLIHTYFTSPWAILSVVAAIVLFALTIAATFYTIYPYYKPNSSDATPAPPPNLTPQPH